jgi:monofunctional biosynthetic peptidoglycan transglycosylase
MTRLNQLITLSIKFIQYGLISIIFLALILFCWYLYLPNPAKLKLDNPQTTAYIDLKCTSKCPLIWTPLSEISYFLKQAVVQAEDAAFYHHNGLSLPSLERALRVNLSEGRFVWGGSTISMQLARNLYLYPDKTIIRKLQEILLSLKIERALTKDRILEIYLNVAEWRPDVFGITAASQYIFKKLPSELSPLDAAFLASILPSPRLASDPDVRKKFSQKGALIFDRLLQEQLPRRARRNSEGSCIEQLHPQEISTVDDILKKIFVDKGSQIQKGDGALLSLDQISEKLDERQKAFIERLTSKFSNGRTPLHCLRRNTLDRPPLNEELLIHYENYADGRHVWLPASASPSINALVKSAAREGIILHLDSGYRDSGYQMFLILKALRARSYCLSEVKSLIEGPGYSEHGCLDNLAFDFSSPEIGTKAFVETKAFQWLKQHGDKFGFSLSYPENTTGNIRYEPWHWRFNGAEKVP